MLYKTAKLLFLTKFNYKIYKNCSYRNYDRTINNNLKHMKSSIKYSKIISDICPGIIILISLYYIDPDIYTSYNSNSFSSSLLSFGFLIFISIFIGKLTNLLGYITQRYTIRRLVCYIMLHINSPYYKKHWFSIRIDNFNDYQKLKIIKLYLQNHKDSQHDFDNDESVKRLMRTTTFIIILLALFTLYSNLKTTFTSEYDDWETFMHILKAICLMLLFIIIHICLLLTTCFVYIYLYYKYIEQAIIITKTNFISFYKFKEEFCLQWKNT